MAQIDLSVGVVIPVFNSEDCVAALAKRLKSTLTTLCAHWEVVFVDDDSQDGVWLKIEEICRDDARFRGLKLMRNQGQAIATLCGLAHVSGDIVVTMDDDLQHRPEDIPALVQPVVDGEDCAFGKFSEKRHSAPRNLGSRFITLLNRKAHQLPEGLYISPFRALSRELVERMGQYQLSRPALAQLIFMSTSRMVNVPVAHDDRFAGKSNYSLHKTMKLALDHFVNSSNLPLRFITVIGLLSCLASFSFGSWVFIRALVGATGVPGWASVIVVQSFLFGFLLLAVGVTSEYLMRILNEVRTISLYRVRFDTRAKPN